MHLRIGHCGAVVQVQHIPRPHEPGGWFSAASKSFAESTRPAYSSRAGVFPRRSCAYNALSPFCFLPITYQKSAAL